MAFIGTIEGGGTNSLGLLKFKPSLSDILQTAAQYSVLASNIGNSGGSTTNGSMGVWPAPGNIVGTAITVGPPGTIELNTDKARIAMQDLMYAYNYFKDMPDTGTYPGPPSGDLAAVTFLPGVYRVPAIMSNTGACTFNAQGNPGAFFLIIANSAYSPAAGSTSVLANGADARNIYWIVEGAISAGANSTIFGNMICMGNVTMGDTTFFNGRLLTPTGMANFSTTVITTAF
jgi:hypothetical protein